jgi:hypothetical protein
MYNRGAYMVLTVVGMIILGAMESFGPSLADTAD